MTIKTNLSELKIINGELYKVTQKGLVKEKGNIKIGEIKELK